MIDFVTNTATDNLNDATALERATDRELLTSFISGDKTAFAVVVQRHSRLVINVCQRILKQSSDAEDACQATFLVLARKAKSLKWQDSIAGWLHQTARRTALKLRATSVRRRDVEGELAQHRPAGGETCTANPATLVAIRELGEVLDAELAGLPAQFREVIILAQVEGLSRDEIAARLGVTVPTVKDRLERGRHQLRQRLLRRGVTLTSAALAAWLVPEAVQAGSLTTLAATTSQAAGAFATNSLAAGASPTAATLAQGVLKMMGLEKLKYAMVWAVSFLTAGGLAFGVLRDDPTRFEKGLRGQIVAVNGGQTSTVTIALEEFDTVLKLDVSPQARIWTAFERGLLTDLKEGQYVSLRIGDDHRTVTDIHIQGHMREASIKSVAPSGKIVIVEEGDDEVGGGRPTEVELAPDAILRIGGLPADRSDFKPGMNVPLEFGRDGKLVNAIEAEAADNTLVEGELLEIDANSNKLVFSHEDDDHGQLMRRSFMVTAETIITLDGKPAKLVDLQYGFSLKMRLSDDGQNIRAIEATAPEAEEDRPQN